MKTPIELAEQHAEFLFPNSIQQIEFSKTGADMNEASQRSFIAGYEAAQPKWIGVETGLPAIGKFYLFFSGGLEIILFYQEEGLFYHGENKWCSPITHWMPLPSPPKTNDNDNP